MGKIVELHHWTLPSIDEVNQLLHRFYTIKKDYSSMNQIQFNRCIVKGLGGVAKILLDSLKDGCPCDQVVIDDVRYVKNYLDNCLRAMEGQEMNPDIGSPSWGIKDEKPAH